MDDISLIRNKTWFDWKFNLNCIQCTCWALSTNFKVLSVSSLFFEEGDIAPTMNVLVFPISDYWSKRVSFDYLKIEEFLTDPFDKALITFPNVVKDKLIFFNSSKC